MKLGMFEINIGPYIQKSFIGARFILAMMIIAGYMYGSVDSETAKLILLFYFASHINTNPNKT